MLELLMDPLTALVVTFFVMSIISIISLVALHFLKNEKVKKGLLYFLSAWGIICCVKEDSQLEAINSSKFSKGQQVATHLR